VLCQFLDEIDYTVAFKAFQERCTYDAADAYYNCIWDTTMLEYLISILLWHIFIIVVVDYASFCRPNMNYVLLHLQNSTNSSLVVREFFYKQSLNFNWIEVMCRALRKSRIHDRRDYRDFAVYRDFWPLPWFRVTAVNIGVLYAISVFKRSLSLSLAVLFHFGRVPVMHTVI